MKVSSLQLKIFDGKKKSDKASEKVTAQWLFSAEHGDETFQENAAGFSEVRSCFRWNVPSLTECLPSDPRLSDALFSPLHLCVHLFIMPSEHFKVIAKSFSTLDLSIV